MASGAKDALAGWGVTVNDEECETLTKGKRLDEIARVWCEYCPLQTDPGVLESAIRKRITGLIATEGEAMDGVYAVLHHFRHRGYRIALATSSSHQVIEAVLSKLNLRGHFDVICSADDERYGKPHPAVYLSALKKLGLPAAECLVIEDSLSGFAPRRPPELIPLWCLTAASTPALARPSGATRQCRNSWRRWPRRFGPQGK